MCFTLAFWLFVSTPVTLKLDIADDEIDLSTITETTSSPRSRTQTVAWIIENFQENYKTLTIQDTIGNRK